MKKSIRNLLKIISTKNLTIFKNHVIIYHVEGKHIDGEADGTLIFEYFKKHPTRKYTKRNLIDNLDMTMPTVNASILAFLKKGFIQEIVEVSPETKNFVNPCYQKYYQITEQGMAFDPDEEERQKKRERLVRRAANREAREREKAERAKANFVS